MMKYLFCFMFSLLAQAQDIESIVDRDPFDPSRGKKEEAEVKNEEPVIEDIDPEEMPILDGTIILGNTKIAIFSLMQEGQSITARVEMKSDGEYDLFLREKKKAPPKKPTRRILRPSRRSNVPEPEEEEEEEEEPKFPLTPIKNGKLAGYTISSIARDHVELNGDSGSLKIAMFQKDTKKERGGTKKAPAKQPVKPVARQLPKRDGKKDGKSVVKPITRADRKKDKKDFQRREMPRGQSEKKVTRDDLKEKF